LPTPTFATSVTAVTLAFVLFNKFGSYVPGVTLTTFVKGPLPGATLTTKMFVTPPAGNTPIVRFVVPPPASTSTTTTFVAVEGPAFVTVITFVYVVPATTVPGPTFVTTTSATFVTTVTTGGLNTGGPFVGTPTATFVTLPPAGALLGATTVTLTFVTAPFVNVPNAHVTIPTPPDPPPLALTKLTPTGNVSVTTTPPATLGPLFVTLNV
jgi:hypothetical protein